MGADQLFITTILCLVIVGSEYLVRKTWFRHAGTALMVILVTALVSNLGIIPTTSNAEQPIPVYDFTFSVVAPLSILWLLLQVNLKDILRAGMPLIILFVIGSLGTALGVILGMWVIDGAETIGPLYHAIGGMFTGTYTGGSVNFNAVAIHYNVMEEGILFAGTAVVDNIITTLWMILTIALPTLLRKAWPGHKAVRKESNEAVDLGIGEDTEPMHPVDLAMTLGIGLGSLWLSEMLAAVFSGIGMDVPAILILTVIALILAQIPAVYSMKGPRALGLFSVYLFLCVIGAYCDFGALSNIGSLGFSLLLFALITVMVHGTILFGLARLFRMDLDMAAIASQANIGGGTTALALARSLGRSDLVLPAVLIGSLGTALGTFLGFWVAGVLG